MTQTRQITLLTFLLMTLMLLSEVSLSQPFYLPTEGLTEVVIKNTSSETQYLWLAAPAELNTDFQEVSFEIPAKQSIKYKFKENELQYPWLQLKSYDTAKVLIQARTIKGTTSLSEGRSEHLVSSLFQTKSQGTLILANLSPIAQDGIILNSSPRGRKDSLTLNLPKFGVEKVSLSVERGDRIRIQAKYPVTATFISQDHSFYTHLHPERTVTNFQINPTGTYFEMINSNSDQSFIFYTEDDLIIKEARRQVLYPEERKILFASIQKGHDNTNRNLSSRLKTPWSWSVSSVQGFGYFGSLSCDGSPSIVEDYLLPWITSEQGICFWGYRIQRELNPEEVMTGYSPMR